MLKMNKRHLHHLFVRLRPIRVWYFLVLFVISSVVALFAMRQNNLTALELRDNVLKADETGGDVEGELKKLREYTYSHMNARLSSDSGIYPPIQLKYRYERLLAAEKQRAASANDNLYNEAQASCEARFPQGLSGGNRIPCIQQYVDTHGKAESREQPIPDALYKFDFVAPVWSPDLAGWSLIVAGVSLVLLITRLLATLWFKHQLDL